MRHGERVGAIGPQQYGEAVRQRIGGVTRVVRDLSNDGARQGRGVTRLTAQSQNRAVASRQRPPHERRHPK
jgi:hypothetical protein